MRIDEVLEDTAMLDGRTIRVNGTVADTVADSALVLASGDGASGDGADSVLVVHQPDVDPAEGSDIGVVGVVRPSFDLPAVETELGVDYDEDLFATFADEPYLLATTVEADNG
ncbi:hypothetical protein [Pseudonocardia sp.]|uniref:hypothetical protein n=1 Tax=Pseudonocardia sp. TaxID=60912 RepID=UPI00263A24DE|nr:hypothetical protein [Pseudonocardia sp.]